MIDRLAKRLVLLFSYRTEPEAVLLSRHKPYIRLQNICKPFLEGKCQKGRRCPYRHEAPLTADTSEQDLNER